MTEFLFGACMFVLGLVSTLAFAFCVGLLAERFGISKRSD